MMRRKSAAAGRPEPVFPFSWFVCFGLAIGLMALVVQYDIDVSSEVLITLIGSLGLAMLVVGLLRPEIPLLALVAYVPFNKVLPGDFGGVLTAFNLTNILMIIAIAGYVLKALAERQPLFERNALNLPVFLFCVLGGVSLIHGALAGYGEAYTSLFIIPLKRWLTPILLFYVVYNAVRDKRTVQRVLVVMLMVVTIAALMAIKDYIDVGNYSSLEKSRIGGICQQPNMLGAFFSYYMFFFASFWLMNWKNGRYWLLLIPFALCFRGIQVTFSRGAYLAFAAGACMLTFFRSKLLWGILVIVSIVVVTNPWLLPQGIAYRFQSTVKEHRVVDVYDTTLVNSLDASSYNRLQIWKGAVKMIASKPVTGVGYGAFPYLIGYFAPGHTYRDAHNSYLIIAAEMGVPTLLVFLWILGIVFWKTRWLYRHAQDRYFKALALGWLGGLGGLLVANMFGSRLHSEEISSYFWILCGLILRAIALERQAARAALPAAASAGNGSRRRGR